MTIRSRLPVAAAVGAIALAAVACTPADRDNDETTRTVVETREVPADPVVVEREVPVVVDRDRSDGERTTIRANEDGIEVETTRDR